MSIPGITKGTPSTMNHLRARRIAVMALTVGITALCVAACGSSSSTGSNSSSSSSAAASGGPRGGANRTKLVACLKSHGVTLPSRPAGAGGGAPPAGSGTRRPGAGGGFFGGGGGRFANNPKFAAAFKACGGQAFGGRRFALNHAAVTKFVACVKQHGYTLPAPNFSGKGAIFPASIEKNAKFQTASKACAADLRPAAGAGGGGAPGGGPPGSGTGTTGA
jgi:hypothetical protein